MSFLQDLTSQVGRNLITGPHKTEVRKDGRPKWVERWVDFRNELETQAAVDYVADECKGVYFALGSFAPAGKNRYRRLSAYCTHLKALWFDIDCGEEKWKKHAGKGCYRTREDGQNAFLAFLESTKLPLPSYVVSSGAGYHIYWRFERDLPIDEWRRMALTLKAICARWGFEADPSRTADASSVLRVPNTQHHSGATVEIIATNDLVTVDAFNAAMDALRPYIQDPVFTQQQDMLAGLGAKPDFAENAETTLSEQELSVPKKFANIIQRSELTNTGCKQLYEMYQHQDTTPEPMWAAALSIARFCIDGNEWAIKISENHPEFDPTLTIRKMEQWSAPRTCLWFSQSNPDGCKGCPHFTGISQRPTQSPIMLGVEERLPVVVEAPMAGNVNDDEEGFTETFIIPEYPFPFYRPPAGGVWIQDNEEGEINNRQVYDFDLYIYDRIGMGADNKPRFWARQHTPHDGVNEIELSSDDVFGPINTLPIKLAAHNILLPPETNTAELYRYLRSQAAQLQRTRAMTNPPRQLGWTANDGFVLGKWEFTKAGRKMSPIPDTNIARNFAESCEVRRDANLQVDNWNKAISALYGANDAATYRLILAMGFGAPIRARFGSEVGGVVNIYSEDSGFGKTTLTKVIAGIFGQSPDPFVLQAQHGTTVTAFFEIISYVNSLPLALDETGQMDTESLMAFVHTCTSGRAKARGSHQANDIRQSLPGWKSHVFSSSNVSLWNRITEARAENEAYLMRIVEIPVRALEQSKDKNYGDDAVREVQKHYGVAGPIFIEHVLHHAEQIQTLWMDVSRSLTERCALHGRHRFWGDIMTAACVGAKVAYDAGVYPFNPQEVFTTACKLLVSLKKRAETKVVSEFDLLSEMLGTYIDSTIVIKDSKTSTVPIRQPLHRAYIRVEVDDAKMFIQNNALREFAKTRQFGIERLEMALEEIGAQRGVPKRMWSNSDFRQHDAPVRTWYIDLTSPLAVAYLDPDRYKDDERNSSSSSSST